MVCPDCGFDELDCVCPEPFDEQWDVDESGCEREYQGEYGDDDIPGTE